MSEQNAPEAGESWADSTNLFVDEAGDALGGLYAPQVKALRALAAQLDAAEEYSPPLAAEYARMHRWLLNKIGKSAGADPADDGSDLLAMLEHNPGAFWKP